MYKRQVNGLGKSFANINPSDTKDIISEYNECDSNQFNQAIEAAKIAQIEWASVGIEKKSNILINIGNELISKSKEIEELLSREEEKHYQRELVKWQELVNSFNTMVRNA